MRQFNHQNSANQRNKTAFILQKRFFGMRNKKLLVMACWLLIALILLGTLLFALFALPGLRVDVKPSQTFNKLDIVVSNQSKHTIRLVSVWQETESATKKLAEIAALQAGEQHAVQIDAQSAKVLVKAVAPFHQSAEQSIFVEPRKPLVVSLDANDSVLQLQAWKVILHICNQTQESRVTVEETHTPKYFGLRFEQKELEIAANECKNAVFTFQPLFSGLTEVFFNVKTLSFSETVSKEVTIRT